MFTNRGRDKLKILYWDRSGFALWYKRLEKAKFPWPKDGTEGVLALSGRELGWLLDGIDFFRLTPHETLRYRSAS